MEILIALPFLALWLGGVDEANEYMPAPRCDLGGIIPDRAAAPR